MLLMRILTLNLQKAISWEKTESFGPKSFDAFFEMIEAAAEDSELILAWPWNSLVFFNKEEGPRAIRPLAAPSFTGMRDPAKPAGKGLILEAGRYVFSQERKGSMEKAEEWLADYIEEFARDIWWNAIQAGGELYLRLVKEDNKTAAQLIRKKE